jgi:hypothetical protein
MNDHVPGVSELLTFISMYPVESMEIHASGSQPSVDLICSRESRLVGVPHRYLQVLDDQGLLPPEIARKLRQLQIVGDMMSGRA